MPSGGNKAFLRITNYPNIFSVHCERNEVSSITAYRHICQHLLPVSYYCDGPNCNMPSNVD